MLVLDTDHFSELERGSPAGKRLAQGVEADGSESALTIVTVEERLRGWLAELARHHEPHRQISAYRKLEWQAGIFHEWIILPWDETAADMFVNLRQQGIRIGTMDLKIACITLAHDATLLSRNGREFSQVPGLRLANWLE